MASVGSRFATNCIGSYYTKLPRLLSKSNVEGFRYKQSFSMK